jgi:ribonuclease M5
METEKLQLIYPVVVEGRYDRQRVLCVADAQVLTTDGFGIFRREEKRALLRTLAERSPLLILTDSDGAGKQIRSFLSSFVPQDRLISVYIPQIPGVEKRKKEPSAAGFLGVEGMEPDLLRELLRPYTDDGAYRRAQEEAISKTDLYEAGLSGGADSAARRDRLAAALRLPAGMTANALLAAVRLLCTREEFFELAERAFEA